VLPSCRTICSGRQLHKGGFQSVVHGPTISVSPGLVWNAESQPPSRTTHWVRNLEGGIFHLSDSDILSFWESLKNSFFYFTKPTIYYRAYGVKLSYQRLLKASICNKDQRTSPKWCIFSKYSSYCLTKRSCFSHLAGNPNLLQFLHINIYIMILAFFPHKNSLRINELY
jgi:hypothetical protein